MAATALSGDDGTASILDVTTDVPSGVAEVVLELAHDVLAGVSDAPRLFPRLWRGGATGVPEKSKVES